MMGAWRKAFEEDRFETVSLGDGDFHIPDPVIMLATKLHSLPMREKDDKRVKDACDSYALLWYSSRDFRDIAGSLRKEFPDLASNAELILKDDLARRTARHLGVERGVLDGVIRQLLSG